MVGERDTSPLFVQKRMGRENCLRFSLSYHFWCTFFQQRYDILVSYGVRFLFVVYWASLREGLRVQLCGFCFCYFVVFVVIFSLGFSDSISFISLSLSISLWKKSMSSCDAL
jgi:hypothetical protein